MKTIYDFLNEFYKKNAEFKNIALTDKTKYGIQLVITEDTSRPFGNKIMFTPTYFIVRGDWGGKTNKFDIRKFIEVTAKPRSIFLKSLMRKGDYYLNDKAIASYGGGFDEIKNLLDSFKTELKSNMDNGMLFGDDIEKIEKEKELNEQKIEEENRIKKLKKSQSNVLSELDKDGNGVVDTIEGDDFNLLLKKHQKTIVEIDRDYVQKFVKVSSYLKTKKVNIQSIFNSIKETPNQEVLNEYAEILKDDIHTYNLILYSSLNMIVSLIEDDMITFYEIYEQFDNLNMFESKYEKDMSQKLTNVGDGLHNLMHEIRSMGNKISNSIDELSYVTEESNKQLSSHLSKINSTMKVGNLINAINTYQNYKTNRNLIR